MGRARRVIGGTATLAASACLALSAAPLAGASPASSLAAKPGLLSKAQTPGFAISDVSRKAITHGSLASCDAFGPIGGVFATETLSSSGSDVSSLNNISEVVVHTGSTAAVTQALTGFRAYVTRCLHGQDGGDALTGSKTPVKYTITAKPLTALPGTKAGVDFTISGVSKVVTKGETVITRLTVPFLVYPAGNNLLVMVPLHFGYAHAGKTTTVTIATTAALSKTVGKLLPVAVKDL